MILSASQRWQREWQEYQRDCRVLAHLHGAREADEAYEADMAWIKAASTAEERALREAERKARIEADRLRREEEDARHQARVRAEIDAIFAGLEELLDNDKPVPTALPEVAEPLPGTSLPGAATLTDLSHSTPVSKPVCDKSVTRKRPSNIVRDAVFLFERTALFTSDVDLPVPVSRRAFLVPYLPKYADPDASFLNTPEGQNLQLRVREAEGIEQTTQARWSSRPLFKPWWERWCQPGMNPTRYRTPAQWRDVTGELAVLYYADVLRTQGEWHGFTLRLNDDVQKQAKGEKEPVDWLYRRLRRMLKKLGLEVPFFMVVEEDANSGRDLHIHGSIGLNTLNLRKARPLIKEAAGLWRLKPKASPSSEDEDEDEDEAENALMELVPKARAHPRQLVKSSNPTARWASYCAKDLCKSSPFFKHVAKNGLWSRAFDDSPLRATRQLNAEAKRLYEADRQLVLSRKAG